MVRSTILLACVLAISSLAASTDLAAPNGVAVSPSGEVYVSDIESHMVFRIARGGKLHVVAGNGLPGYGGDGGPASAAQLRGPSALSFDTKGNLYIADSFNHRIRRIDTHGVITTVAGTGKAGYGGDDGPATGADLNSPGDVLARPDGSILIADSYNHLIRQVDAGGVMRLVAGSVPPGFGGDDGPAAKALMSMPFCLAVSPGGEMVFCDSGNSRLRRVDEGGIVRHVAGSGPAREIFGAGFEGDGGPGTAAKLFTPAGLATGPDGTLYISDTGNNRVRALGPDGKIRTIAEGFLAPQKVVLLPGGDLIVADRGNRRVCQVKPDGSVVVLAQTPKT
jgi:serine/threonine-protein kinase